MWLFMLVVSVVVVVGFNGCLIFGRGATAWSPFVDGFANNAYTIRLLFYSRLLRRRKGIILSQSDSTNEP